MKHIGSRKTMWQRKLMLSSLKKSQSHLPSPVYRFSSTLAWKGGCTCSVSVSHPGMWYKACFCHLSAPESALHCRGPRRPKQWAPCLQLTVPTFLNQAKVQNVTTHENRVSLCFKFLSRLRFRMSIELLTNRHNARLTHRCGQCRLGQRATPGLATWLAQSCGSSSCTAPRRKADEPNRSRTPSSWSLCRWERYELLGLGGRTGKWKGVDNDAEEQKKKEKWSKST